MSAPRRTHIARTIVGALGEKMRRDAENCDAVVAIADAIARVSPGEEANTGNSVTRKLDKIRL